MWIRESAGWADECGGEDDYGKGEWRRRYCGPESWRKGEGRVVVVGMS